jgi:hypothetical protein
MKVFRYVSASPFTSDYRLEATRFHVEVSEQGLDDPLAKPVLVDQDNNRVIMPSGAEWNLGGMNKFNDRIMIYIWKSLKQSQKT